MKKFLSDLIAKIGVDLVYAGLVVLSSLSALIFAPVRAWLIESTLVWNWLLIVGGLLLVLSVPTLVWQCLRIRSLRTELQKTPPNWLELVQLAKAEDELLPVPSVSTQDISLLQEKILVTLAHRQHLMRPFDLARWLGDNELDAKHALTGLEEYRLVEQRRYMGRGGPHWQITHAGESFVVGHKLREKHPDLDPKIRREKRLGLRR